MNNLDTIPTETMLHIILQEGLNFSDIKAVCDTNSSLSLFCKKNKKYILNELMIKYKLNEDIKDFPGNLIYFRKNVNDKSSHYEFLKEYFYYYNLEKIDIDEKNISSMISYLPNLRRLNCGANKLTYLPNYPNLQRLYCGGNKLTYLPNYPNLQVLYCGFNRITELGNYPKLENLKCENNQLTTLPNYPKLENLNCENNQLTTLPSYPNLEYLTCNNNQLTAIN